VREKWGRTICARFFIPVVVLWGESENRRKHFLNLSRGFRSHAAVYTYAFASPSDARSGDLALDDGVYIIRAGEPTTFRIPETRWPQPPADVVYVQEKKKIAKNAIMLPL